MSALHSTQFADIYDPKAIEISFCIPYNTSVHFWRSHTEGFINVLADWMKIGFSTLNILYKSLNSTGSKVSGRVQLESKATFQNINIMFHFLKNDFTFGCLQ